MSIFTFITSKSKSFVRLVANSINENYKNMENNSININAPIFGKLYFSQPNLNVKFTFTKEELLGKVDKDIYEKLPELMYYV